MGGYLPSFSFLAANINSRFAGTCEKSMKSLQRDKSIFTEDWDSLLILPLLILPHGQETPEPMPHP